MFMRSLHSSGRSCSYSGCVCAQAQDRMSFTRMDRRQDTCSSILSPVAVLDKSGNFSLGSSLICDLEVTPPCTAMFWEVACDNILKLQNSRCKRSVKHIGTYFTGRGHMNLEFGNPKNHRVKETWRSFFLFLLGFQVKIKHVVLTTVFTSI